MGPEESALAAAFRRASPAQRRLLKVQLHGLLRRLSPEQGKPGPTAKAAACEAAALALRTPRFVFAVGSGGSVLRSADRCRTFRDLDPAPEGAVERPELLAVDVFGQHLAAVGNRGAVAVSRGGQSVSRPSWPSAPSLRSVACLGGAADSVLLATIIEGSAVIARAPLQNTDACTVLGAVEAPPGAVAVMRGRSAEGTTELLVSCPGVVTVAFCRGDGSIAGTAAFPHLLGTVRAAVPLPGAVLGDLAHPASAQPPAVQPAVQPTAQPPTTKPRRAKARPFVVPNAPPQQGRRPAFSYHREFPGAATGDGAALFAGHGAGPLPWGGEGVALAVYATGGPVVEYDATAVLWLGPGWTDATQLAHIPFAAAGPRDHCGVVCSDDGRRWYRTGAAGVGVSADGGRSWAPPALSFAAGAAVLDGDSAAVALTKPSVAVPPWDSAGKADPAGPWAVTALPPNLRPTSLRGIAVLE